MHTQALKVNEVVSNLKHHVSEAISGQKMM